ncbi:phosphotransferase [Mycobacterium sp. MBM]|nr:phosphotransferase [Mycobacterium sp. MBM]
MAAIVDDRLVAERALAEYDISGSASLHLLNLSENATYLVTDGQAQSILRVHRQNYHGAHEIESELDWLAALSTDGEVRVPHVRAARDGRRVVTVESEGAARHVVRFDMVGGVEPDEKSLSLSDFHTLGRITAALHEHALRWTRPPGFRRFSWDWEHCFGHAPRWGRWQDAEGVGSAERAILGRAEQLLHTRLHEYGTASDRFGLVHADLRLANLLVHTPAGGSDSASAITVIDFDDCGFGWYLYDFGTAVSFIEDDPALPQWQAAWVQGYRTRRTLSTDHENMLASFVLMRRLLLLAWMGSHSHSRESATKAVSYATGSCELAERYLSAQGLRLT